MAKIGNYSIGVDLGGTKILAAVAEIINLQIMVFIPGQLIKLHLQHE